LEIAALEFGRCCRCYAGGFVAVHFMSDPSNVSINPKPLTSWLLGIDAPYGKLLPMRSLAIKYFNHLRIF
jgi:hypothetical protein